MRKVALFFAVVMMCCVSFSSRSLADTISPEAWLKDHGNQLLKILSEKNTKSRYLKLRRFANKVFNRNEMSRLAMGKHWKNMSDDQREALKEVLFDYFVVTYGSVEMGFQGFDLQILEKVNTGKDILLKTMVDISGDGKDLAKQIKKKISSDDENKDEDTGFIILFALRTGANGYYIRDAKFEGQSIIMFVRERLEKEYKAVSYDMNQFLNELRTKINSRYRAAEDLAKKQKEKKP